MHSRITRAAWFVLTVLLVAPLAASAQTSERSRTQGLKETDRFVKTGGATSQVTTSQQLTTLGRAPIFNDNRVEVEPVGAGQ